MIAAPFLENIKDFSTDNDIEDTTYLHNELRNLTINISKDSTNITNFSESIPKIIYPFSIVGIVALLVTAFHLGVCIISPIEEERPKGIAKIDNTERSFLFMFFTVIFTFAIFFVVAGIEIACAQTLTIYSVKSSLHLTAIQGSYITSAYWTALTVGRLASVYLSVKISCLKLIIGDVCLVAIAALILLFLMPNEWALWLASLIAGLGIAPAYAAVVGWLNDYIIITNKFSAIFTISGAAGDMIVPFVITYFINTVPEMFPFVVSASAILMGCFVFTLYCVFQKGNKTKKSKGTENNDTDEVERKY